MPVVPTYVNQVGAASASQAVMAPNIPVRDALGESLGMVASAAGGLITAKQKEVERQQNLEVVNILSQNPFDEEYLAARSEAPADGSGLVDSVRQRKADYTNRILSSTEDFSVRRKLEAQINQTFPTYLRNAETEQYKMRGVYETEQTNTSINALQNGVNLDPARYDMNLALGRELIQNARVENGQREGMKIALSQNLASARFAGMLSRAKTPEDIDGVKADFLQERWAQEMKPAEYEQLGRRIEDRKNNLGVKVSAEKHAYLKMVGASVDAYNVPSQETKLELSATARNYAGSAVGIEAAANLRKITFLEGAKSKTLPELRSAVAQLKEGTAATSRMPPRLADAVAAATSVGSAVSPAYLFGVINAEYGGELAKGSTDWNVVNKGDTGSGSSTGVAQFTDDTWQRVVGNPAFQKRFGVDLTGKTKEEILALRASPEVSMMATVALAEQDKAQLERGLGRSVSDAELYVAHFMGAGEATKFLSVMETTPFADAASTAPVAAGNNKGMFAGKTVKAVYDDLAHRMGTSPAAINYNDVAYAQGYLGKAEKAAKDGTILEHYAEMHPEEPISSLDFNNAESFAERGVQVEKLAKMYGVPVSRVKPLTTAEVDGYVSALEEASTEQQLSVLKRMVSMGPASENAIRQLGDKSPTSAVAANLAVKEGKQDDALLVLRGMRRLNDDKASKEALGEDTVRNEAFASAVGEAVGGLPPDFVSSIRKAADAHFVEANKAESKWNLDAYKKSVAAVLGGRLDEVNGAKTILPTGVVLDDAEGFMERVQPEELLALNVPPPGVEKQLPLDSRGKPIDMYRFARQAKLEALAEENGGVLYGVLLGGKPAVVRDGEFLRPFKFRLDAETARRISNKNMVTAKKLFGG